MRGMSCLNQNRGFTLIEVMVVLIIVGVLGSGFSLGMNSLREREIEQNLKRLKLVLEISIDRAMTTGQSISLELIPDGYRFAILGTDDMWRPYEDPPIFTQKRFPEDISWSGLRIEGVPELGINRIQFTSQPIGFELLVKTPVGMAKFIGRRNGAVSLYLPRGNQ